MNHNNMSSFPSQQQPPRGGGGAAPQQQQQLAPSALPVASSSAPVKRYSAVGDSFGLLGLQPVVSQQAEHPEAANILKLTRGFDLANLVVPVTQTEPLHPNMSSLWSDTPFVIQPDYRLPSCYQVQSPKLNFHFFQKFHLETLFYVFYSMPRDVLQVAAATELHSREWRYHKTLQMWLTKKQNEHIVKSQHYEKGTYRFFDPTTWSIQDREDFTLEYAQLEEMKPMTSAPQQQQQQQQQAPAGGAAAAAGAPPQGQAGKTPVAAPGASPAAPK